MTLTDVELGIKLNNLNAAFNCAPKTYNYSKYLNLFGSSSTVSCFRSRIKNGSGDFVGLFRVRFQVRKILMYLPKHSLPTVLR